MSDRDSGIEIALKELDIVEKAMRTKYRYPPETRSRVFRVAGARVAQRALGSHLVRPLEIPEAMEDRVSKLESRMERQEHATEELQFRANSGFSQERIDKVVEYMEGAFGELEGVEQVRYLILDDGTWRVLAIHSIEDRVEALKRVCKKSVQVERAFGDMDVLSLVMHKTEVLPEHLAGTKEVFARGGADSR